MEACCSDLYHVRGSCLQNSVLSPWQIGSNVVGRRRVQVQPQAPPLAGLLLREAMRRAAGAVLPHVAA